MIRSQTFRLRRRRRGAALFTALVTVAVLASVTALASRDARQSARLVSTGRALAVARTMAESGVLAARARLETQLQAATDSSALVTLFDVIEARAPWASDTLLDGAFSSVLVNVSARLDVNSAGVEGLTTLFRTVAPPADAARVATLIDARVRGLGESAAVRDSAGARDSLMTALLGRALPRSRGVRPFESLDEVAALVGETAPWLPGVAEQLTVDGDGYVDRRHAAPAVLRAAAGSLVDRPTRVLIVSRGWALGEAATQEIQAVYAIEGAELRLVRWREQLR